MKIKGFSGQHSTEEKIALVTEPLNESVISHFLPLYQSHQELAAVPLSIEGGTIFLRASHLPNGFLDFMETLLTQAEGMVANDQIVAREKAGRGNNDAPQEFLRRIAESQGRPIL
jgi:hypothetical protein